MTQATENSNPSYYRLANHYEKCFEQWGDNHRGVDWPRAEDAEKRYRVMSEVIRPDRRGVSLLDFGCGAGHFLEYLTKRGERDIQYTGLDISEKFISHCRSKYPKTHFHCLDILSIDTAHLKYDYIVANGVFTEKLDLTDGEMFSFFQRVVVKLFNMATEGIAFNVMSLEVDWRRDDLFHLSMDALAHFLASECSRHFVIRNDYGLYDYTVYLYRGPN